MMIPALRVYSKIHDYWIVKDTGEFRPLSWIIDNISYQDHIQYVHMVYSAIRFNSWMKTILPIVEGKYGCC